MNNNRTDVFISLILGVTLSGILIFDEVNNVINKILIGLGFAFFSWIVFWTDRKKLKQPISGALTLVRLILANIIDMIVRITSIACCILPLFMLFGFLGEWLFGEKGSIIGCLISIIVGFPFGFKLASFLKKRFLEERLTNKDLIILEKKHEVNRLAFREGKGYFFPLTILTMSTILILLFLLLYPEKPDYEIFLFFPFGIFITMVGVLSLFNSDFVINKSFFHKEQKVSVKIMLIICIFVAIVITISIGYCNPKYNIIRSIKI